MTALASVDFGSPEHANVRLAGREFLYSADLPAFDRLIIAIRGLAPPEDNVDQFLPSSNEMHGWDKGFAIYQALKRKPAKREEVWTDSYSRITSQKWSEYLVNHAALAELVGRQITASTYEYLGLQPDDLQSPSDNGGETDSRYGGRHPQWGARADRISAALNTWKHMSADERQRLPLTITVRKICAALVESEKREVELEKRVAALEAQNSIPNKGANCG
jgi:hypothetical protein